MKCYNDYIVDIGILKQNVSNIKAKINNETKYCAIVKANAYGLGLEAICTSLKGIADYFGTACLKEALAIRLFDKETKILILGLVDNKNYPIISEQNISISISGLEQLIELDKIIDKKINVHIQINTGMNRFGFKSLNEFKKALKIIQGNKFIVLEGVYTHFATKEKDLEFVNKQYLRFLQFKRLVDNMPNIIFHISNSFATNYSNKYNFDMVRTGFLMYGYTENNIGNFPVLSIKSKIIYMFKIRKGDTVGYDRTYIAKKPMQIGIVPIGYADGFDRRLSNNFSVLIGGKKCPVIGRICMDVFMVDLSLVENPNVYQEVVVLGKQGKEEITLSDYSTVLGTSAYDILCKFNYRRMNYIVKNNKNT